MMATLNTSHQHTHAGPINPDLETKHFFTVEAVFSSILVSVIQQQSKLFTTLTDTTDLTPFKFVNSFVGVAPTNLGAKQSSTVYVTTGCPKLI